MTCILYIEAIRVPANSYCRVTLRGNQASQRSQISDIPEDGDGDLAQEKQRVGDRNECIRCLLLMYILLYIYIYICTFVYVLVLLLNKSLKTYLRNATYLSLLFMWQILQY